jgi:hypothetical protein
MTAIHDPELFMSTFKPGDTFWQITTEYSEPTGVVELVFVCIDEDTTELYKDDPCMNTGWIFVRHPTGRHATRLASVGDICNRHHGAFNTKEAALAELAR